LWDADPGSVTIATIVEHPIGSSLDGPTRVRSSDIDGDGDIDVLGSAYSEISWWENLDGLGVTWNRHMLYSGLLIYPQGECSDIDGDGSMDVLGALCLSDLIVWWDNVDGLGTSWVEHSIGGYFYGAYAIYSADIDGDGDVDVVAASASYGHPTWWENVDGLGTFWIEHTIEEVGGCNRSIYADDINGDGCVDVLGGHSSNDEIVWWENVDGLGTTWIKRIIDGSFDSARSVHSNDVDGDGDIDVLGAAYGADEIIWWENADGAGTNWIEHPVDAEFDGALSVYSDDLDGDGDIDVLGAAAAISTDDIVWWENSDGSGTSWIEHIVDADFMSADCVYSDDLDGDGETDVLGAAEGDDMISWWDLHADFDSASLESSILYIGCDPDWGSLLWTAQNPPGTAVSFQVRASDDYTQMGAWSDTLTVPCSLHGVLADNASYIQYRAILTTADPDTTPTLLDVTVTWDPLGTGEGEGPATLELLPFSPNPISGPIAVSFGLPSAMMAGFSVFDVSGRVVVQKPAAEYPAGYQQNQLGELPPGIYICRMSAGSFTATQRFAVVE